MITKEYCIPINELSPDISFYFPEDALVFDIETTGFSSKTAYLYLVGCAYQCNGVVYLKQFLACGKEQEGQVLTAFTQLCNGFKQLISYNGDGFDIPFLCDKARKYEQSFPRDGMVSNDLYKQLKPFQVIMKLANLKQKTVEEFMGIVRTDRFSGGELINHYLNYAKNPAPEEEALLLLHNYEDVLGLIKLLPIQSYCEAFQGGYRFLSTQRNQAKDYLGNNTDNLLITAELTHAVPKPVSYSKGSYYFSLYDKKLKLNVLVKDDKIRVPYPDYKNYCYLEKEDMAVLKELAGSIDKKDKRPATIATSYGKFQLNEENSQSESIFQPYIQRVLELLLKWNE